MAQRPPRTLNVGQTFLLTTTIELTGTGVTSDKPIAVFSGYRCANVPTGVTACDHIVEQMPPTDALSRTYCLAQTPRTGTLGNVCRAVATQDGTEVQVNGTVVATLNTGQFCEGRVAGGIEISANNPILVGQYLTGQSQAGANTNPAMTIVPGQNQWLSSYVFSPPAGAASFPADFVSIVIGTPDIPTLLLDGAGVDPGLFQPLGETSFSFGNIDVSAKTGPFRIPAANPFQLLLSGFDFFDSYLTCGGAAFAPGASPPPNEEDPPPPPPATVLFWDGDRSGNAGNNVDDGGDGVCTRTSTNITTADGSVDLSLPVAPVTLVFAGAPRNVEIDSGKGPIRLFGLRFDIDGYRLFGDGIELAGPVSEIRVGDGTEAGAALVARIESVLTGETRVQKTDRGTLLLAGANTCGGGPQEAAGEIALTGPASVEGGRLDLVGNLGGSAVTVGAGAVLGGTGTAGATRIGAGGRIAPGLSIGAITIAGDTRVSRFISVVQELDANNVHLGVRQTASLASAARTPNQIAAATGADSPGNGALHTALADLQTDAEAEAAFAATSGGIHASAGGAALEDSRFVREAVRRRLGGADQRAVWMHAYGTTGRFEGDGNAADMRRRLAGFFLAIDLVRGAGGFSAGLVTGAGGGSAQVRARASGATLSDARLGAYAACASGRFRLSGGLAQMWRKADTRRRADFPGFSDFLEARTDLELLQAFGEVGHAFDLGQGTNLEPFGQMAWVTVKTRGFRETGGTAALVSPGASNASWLTHLGARVAVPIPGGRVRLTASAAWRHVGGDDRRTPIALDLAAGPAFSVLGAPLTRDAAAPGAGLVGEIAPRAEVEVSYSGLVGGAISDHGGRASLRIRF